LVGPGFSSEEMQVEKAAVEFRPTMMMFDKSREFPLGIWMLLPNLTLHDRPYYLLLAKNKTTSRR